MRRIGILALLAALPALLHAPAARADHAGAGNVEARLSLDEDNYTLVLGGGAGGFDRSAELAVELTLTPKDGSRVVFGVRGEPCLDSQFCEARADIPAQEGDYRLRASVYQTVLGSRGPSVLVHDDLSGSLVVGPRQAPASDGGSGGDPGVDPVPGVEQGSPEDLGPLDPDNAAGLVIAPGATDAFDVGAPLQCQAEGARAPSFRLLRPRLPTIRRGVSCAEDPAGRFSVGRRIRTLVTSSTTFTDSLGEPMMVLVRSGRRWSVDAVTGGALRPSLPLLNPSGGGRLTIQGYACPESAGVLVAFDTVPGRAIRGFVDPSAVPATLRRGLPRTGCRSRGGTSADVSAFALADPALPGRYFDGRGRRTTRSYGFYDLRYVGPRKYLYVMANTTMVHGGGVVRAVVSVPSAFLRSDGFDYCDPNGAGRDARVTRTQVAWSYGQVLSPADGTRTGIFGWVPTRALTGADQPAGCL